MKFLFQNLFKYIQINIIINEISRNFIVLS